MGKTIPYVELYHQKKWFEKRTKVFMFHLHEYGGVQLRFKDKHKNGNLKTIVT